jgi:hypothetical protein
MWQVDNRTPFAVEGGWLRDRNGAEIWLVAVKATFVIKPDGTTEIAEEQPPVLRVPEYHGEPGKSSLKYEADLILTKKTSDVLVVGHAYAPGGKPVTELDVGFRVGQVQKMLKVFGDRQWGAFGATSPQPFTKMPLTYERAFGGVDKLSEHPERDWEWRNPVGTGFVIASAHADALPLPNIENPKEFISGKKDKPSPAGFGPLCSHWQPRVSFAGTYDDHWMKTRQPLLPEDFDDRFYQCAPQDQQAPSYFSGGEEVILKNISPLDQLFFVLPRISFSIVTKFLDGERRQHPVPLMHTVILEPDFPRFSLVYHSSIECHAKVYQLENTQIKIRHFDSESDDDEDVENLLDLV